MGLVREEIYYTSSGNTFHAHFQKNPMLICMNFVAVLFASARMLSALIELINIQVIINFWNIILQMGLKFAKSFCCGKGMHMVDVPTLEKRECLKRELLRKLYVNMFFFHFKISHLFSQN
jgi:hypothetical protein